MENLIAQKSEIEYSVLKVLELHYSSAAEILEMLNKKQIEFQKRNFFPLLSKLLLENLLCYNWLKNKNGMPVKYYHLTKTGYFHINRDMN